MTAAFPPRPVPGAEPRSVSLTGCISPFYADNRPSLLRIPGAEGLYLAVFSNRQSFDTFIEKWPVDYDKLVQIMDHQEFLDSIPLSIRVILDPRPHPTDPNLSRYTELFRDS